MAIEIGALALAIRDQGGDAVLAKLKAIDTKAKDTGSKPVTVPVSAPGAAKVEADLAGVDASAKAAARSVTTLGDKLKAIGGIGGRIGLLTDGLKFDSTREAATKRLTAYEAYFTKQLQAGNLPVQQRIALEQQLASVRSALAPATDKAIAKQSAFAASIGQVGAALKAQVAFLGVAGAVGGASVFILDSARAYDDAEAAARKLTASAKLTGAALADVQRIAKEGEQTFRLSAGASADLTANIIKLTSRAEQLNQSGVFMTRWLDLAAANGLSAAEAMQALQTTIIGQDEGLNRLGLANPMQIYEGWARAAGMSAAKMTEAQKAQAIINEIVTKGALVQGEYANRLDSAAGKSEQLRKATEGLKIELGRMFLGAREGVTGGGSSLLGWLTSAVKLFNDADAAAQRFWTNLWRQMRGQAPVGITPDPKVTFETLDKDPPVPPAARAAAGAARGPDAATRAAAAEALRLGTMQDQLAAIATMARLRTVDVETLQVAARLEAQLTAELQRGTASLERRAQIQAQLADLRGTGTLIQPLQVQDIARQIDAQPATVLEVPVELRPSAVTMPGVAEDMQGVGLDLGMTLGAALAAGIQQSISGDATNGIAAIGAAVLGAIGDMFVSIGVTALAGSKFVAGILAGLATLNPFAMAAAAVGLIAVGAAIKGAASRAVRGGSGGGSGGGFGGSSSSSSLDGRETIADAQIRRATLQPGAAGVGTARAGTMATGPTLQVIGVDSPQGQRLIGTASQHFTRRGGT